MLKNGTKFKAVSAWEQDVAGSHFLFEDRQARLSCEERGNHGAERSYPVIPTIKGGLSHSDQASFSFPVRFRSLMFATKTKSCFAFIFKHSDKKTGRGVRLVPLPHFLYFKNQFSLKTF